MTSNIELISQSNWSIRPPSPHITPRMCRNMGRFPNLPGLLVVPRGGRPHFLSGDMEFPFWQKWFDHIQFGDLCYAYWAALHFFRPLCYGNTFRVSVDRLRGPIIESIDVSCTKCNMTTVVDQSWFYSFTFDANGLLCCHKRYTYKYIWNTLFWAMNFYNSLSQCLTREGHRVQPIPEHDRVWSMSPFHRTAVRSFSSGSLRELHNGEWHEKTGVYAKIQTYRQNA